MSQGGRVYTDRITLNPPVDAPGDGAVNLYAVADDPNGTLDGDVGDRAFQIGSSTTWVCTGGTVWELQGSTPTASAWDIILRPSEATNEAENQYATFQEAYDAAALINGEVTIWVDSPGVAITVPVGTYDLEQITFRGWYYPDIPASLPMAQHQLETSEGVVFENAINGFENIAVIHDAATTPLITLTCPTAPGQILARTGTRSYWAAVGAAALITFVAGTGVVGQLVVEPLTRVGDGVVDSIAIGAGVTLLLRNSSGSLADDSISGAVGTTLSEVVQFGSLPTLAGFLGTRSTTSSAGLLPYTPAVDANWANPDPTTIQSALDRIAAQLAIVGAAPIP